MCTVRVLQRYYKYIQVLHYYSTGKMTKRGYRGVSLKSEVVEMLRTKAKAEGKTLSVFLKEVLQSYSKGDIEVLQKGSTLTKGDLEEVREEVKRVREILEEYRRCAITVS